MYCYHIISTLVDKNNPIDFTQKKEKDLLEKAIKKTNNGSSFRRYKRNLKLIAIHEKSITFELTSKNILSSPGRCLATVSKLLVQDPMFANACKHKKLFYNDVKKLVGKVENSGTDLEDIKLLIEIFFDEVSFNENDKFSTQIKRDIKKLLNNYRLYQQENNER